MITNCNFCKTDFKCEKSNRKYCSQQCSTNSQRSQKSYNCSICNKEFSDKSSSKRKVCSLECAAKHLSIKHKGKRLWKHKDIKPLAKFNCLNCGKEKEIAECRLKIEGKYCSRKCSNSHIKRNGESNPNWRGGNYPKLKAIRNSIEYKDWRREVFYRDKWSCVLCGYRSNGKNDIDADHIKQFSLFPEIRFDVSNGRTLCKPCHKNTETYGNSKKDIINNSNFQLSNVHLVQL